MLSVNVFIAACMAIKINEVAALFRNFHPREITTLLTYYSFTIPDLFLPWFKICSLFYI